jgi:hypothetical protein
LSSDSYWGHSHYKYDQAAGRTKFTAEVNHIFERNGMAFQLRDGRVERLLPFELQEALAVAVFRTGDSVLDGLLETSRHKFLHRDLTVRQEALEKLWDAWERLKTIEDGKDKKTKTLALCGRPRPTIRSSNDSSRSTTTHRDRQPLHDPHTETDKTPITDAPHRLPSSGCSP